MQKFTLLTIAVFLTLGLAAQDLFNVRVGSFQDVKASDFANLQEMGFVYGAPRDQNVTDVYVGNFSTEAKATEVAETLKQQGFRSAQAFALPTTTGQEVTVVQIAYHTNNQPMDWADLEQAGQLFVEAIDGKVKVVTGVYPSNEVAAQFLPAIKELGYKDAFVKKINNVRLVPVGIFETGIKKPLIPIELQRASTVSSPAAPPNPTEAAPITYGNTAVLTPQPTTTAKTGTASDLASLPAVADVAGLPEIDGKTKRHSAAELQRVLKERGYYEGSIDGYYGPGTSRAYLAAWDDLPEIRKYRLLTGGPFAPSGNNLGTTPSDWPEVSVMLSIAEDLAASHGNSTRAREMVQQRASLFNARQALAPVAATRARNWSSTIWANLDDWATEDPLHAQIITAFRIAYHQSQVRLEDMYMQRGLGPFEARDLAIASLQNLTGAQLDRFL